MDRTRRILLFDGDCGLCTSCASWIAARWPEEDPPHAVAYQLLDDDDRAAIGLTIDQLASAAWWIDGPRAEAGSQAIGQALSAADGCWRVAGRLLLIPPLSWIAPFAYRLVARYRSKLPGGTPACAAGSAGGSRSA